MCSVSTSRSAPATGMLGILQRADDRLEQRPALAHQHQHVAGPCARAPSTASPARRSGAPACTRGLVSLSVSNGASQPSISRSLGRLDQRPDLDQPGRGVGQRYVRRHAGLVGGDAGEDFARARTPGRPRRARPRRSGTNGGSAGSASPAPACRIGRANCAPHLVECARRRALEREDRLLLVADREDRAPHVRPRAAGRELRDDGAHDLPLLRAGVLRLVDQHVIDAEVELVVHPGGGRASRTAPASCRSGRRSRAARGAPSRRGSARSRRRRW